MKSKFLSLPVRLFLIVIVSLVLLPSCAPYLKMNPVADADKSSTATPPDNSCWMATASNMLAGAGYGTGTTVQQRADNIYSQMIAQYGIANPGWPQTALQWWLGSSNNTWTTNPYTLVTWHGNTSMYPWNRNDIPMFIGNELRKCHFLGLAFSWPTNAVDRYGIPIIGYGGHATTPWGDSFSKLQVTLNPFDLLMSDSDRDTGGDLQKYYYDSYSNPNPGGANEGSGCYFNYSTNHPYIRGIVSLEPTDNISDNRQTQIVTGSYRIHQGNAIPASDLHYTVGTDVNILTYRTTIDWDNFLTPTITESSPVRDKLTVDWDLKSKTVPWCKWVTITTEFVLPNWNGIYYKDVHFTYPKGEWIKLPDVAFKIETPIVRNAEKIQDIVGGYVVGSFEIVNMADTSIKNTYEFRFMHQYSWNQNPEQHLMTFPASKRLVIKNLRIGHSYGKLTNEDLWKFSDWLTVMDKQTEIGDKGLEVRIEWRGKLPYPRGIDVQDAIKDIKERKPPKPQLKTVKLKTN